MGSVYEYMFMVRHRLEQEAAAKGNPKVSTSGYCESCHMIYIDRHNCEDEDYKQDKMVLLQEMQAEHDAPDNIR